MTDTVWSIFNLLVSSKRKETIKRMRKEWSDRTRKVGRFFARGLDDHPGICVVSGIVVISGLFFWGLRMITMYGTLLPTVCKQPVGVEILESLRTEPTRWDLTGSHLTRDEVKLLRVGSDGGYPASLNIAGMEFTDPSCVYYISKEARSIAKSRRQATNQAEIDLDLVK